MRSATLTYGKRQVEVYYFDSRFFTVDGKRYEIVGTGDIKGETVHQVKGAKEIKTMKHTTLVKLFKAGKLLTIKN